MNTQPTLILIHGSRHDNSAWAQLQPHLAAARIGSHAPTLRGRERAAKRQTFGASGGSEGYSSTGELLAIHRADLVAIRAEAA
jgi:hypothetical protein